MEITNKSNEKSTLKKEKFFRKFSSIIKTNETEIVHKNRDKIILFKMKNVFYTI